MRLSFKRAEYKKVGKELEDNIQSLETVNDDLFRVLAELSVKLKEYNSDDGKRSHNGANANHPPPSDSSGSTGGHRSDRSDRGDRGDRRNRREG